MFQFMYKIEEVLVKYQNLGSETEIESLRHQVMVKCNTPNYQAMN